MGKSSGGATTSSGGLASGGPTERCGDTDSGDGRGSGPGTGSGATTISYGGADAASASAAAAIIVSIWWVSLMDRHSPMARSTSTAITATPPAASTAPTTPPIPSGVAQRWVQPTLVVL